MQEKLLSSILDELKRLNKLTGVLATRGMSAGDAIAVLDKVGLTPKEIANVLGVTANAVSISLHRQKKGSQQNSQKPINGKATAKSKNRQETK